MAAARDVGLVLPVGNVFGVWGEDGLFLLLLLFFVGVWVVSCHPPAHGGGGVGGEGEEGGEVEESRGCDLSGLYACAVPPVDWRGLCERGV